MQSRLYKCVSIFLYIIVMDRLTQAEVKVIIDFKNMCLMQGALKLLNVLFEYSEVHKRLCYMGVGRRG